MIFKLALTDIYIFQLLHKNKYLILYKFGQCDIHVLYGIIKIIWSVFYVNRHIGCICIMLKFIQI